jgi:tRNA (cytidine/uridine-2'-O-)-methyltransferase
MQIALYEPEIPPNTGTIARLCAAVTTRLNLIEPLGFSLEDKYLKRAGLDYWPHVDVRVWKNWDAFTGSLPPAARLIMTSARKGQSHHRFAFHTEDIIVLGPETRGLPEKILATADHLVRIPIWGQVRSINLANCASVLLYEALRQTGELDRHEPAP